MGEFMYSIEKSAQTSPGATAEEPCETCANYAGDVTAPHIAAAVGHESCLQCFRDQGFVVASVLE